jgi:hypothetical protein
MKPSFSPARVTIGDSGRPRFDDDADVVLRALSLSPGPSRRPLGGMPAAASACSGLQLLLQGVVHAVLSGVVVSIGTAHLSLI